MDILKWSEQFKKDMTVNRYDLDDTIPNYVSQIKQFMSYFDKVYDSPKHIPTEKIKDYLLTKCASNSQRHTHSAIKLFYRLTIHQPNKLKFVPYAKKEKKLPQPLEVNEILVA